MGRESAWPDFSTLPIGRGSLVSFAVLWTLIVLLPLLGLVVWSFLETDGFRVAFRATVNAYRELFDTGRWTVATETLRVVAIVTFIELLIAFPFALWLAKSLKSPLLRALTLALLTVPFFLSMSARAIVWRAILGRNGLVNDILAGIGLVDEPVEWLLFSEFSVHFGLIGPYFATMVFPIFLAVVLIDDEVLDASEVLGASWWFTLVYVIVPLSLPGVIAGITFTAVPMLGETVIPQLIGGRNVVLLGDSIEGLLTVLNYSVAAALSVVVLIIMVALLSLLRAIIAQRGMGEIFSHLHR